MWLFPVLRAIAVIDFDVFSHPRTFRMKAKPSFDTTT